MEPANARHSSDSKEHYTPAMIVCAAHLTMGDIDLDPASCAAANSIIKATQIYTAEENGFDVLWFGRVFLNPPGGKCDDAGRPLFKIKAQSGYTYSDGTPCTLPARSAQKLWWQKLAREHVDGNVTAAVFVGFSIEILQTTQVDSAGLLPLDFPMCFPGRRVAYMHDSDGGLVVGSSPPHASVIVYLPTRGSDAAEFAAAFARIGRVIRPMGMMTRWRAS